MSERDDDAMIEHVVCLRFVVAVDDPRWFDAVDLMTLAREGVESHYDVLAASVEPVDGSGDAETPQR